MQSRHRWQACFCVGVFLTLGARLEAGRCPLVGFPELRGVTVRDVLQDSSGAIWLAADNGLWRWSNGEFVPEGNRFSIQTPAECLLERSGVLWAGTGDGVVGVDLSAMAKVDGPAQLKGMRVYRMVPDAAGWIWCATSGGLFRLHLSGPTATADLVSGSGGRNLRSLAADSSGRVWAGADGVLLEYDSGTLSERYADVIDGREVRALAVDADGTLWVGLHGRGGVYRLTDGSLSPVVYPSRRLDVNVIVPHPNGEIWIGTETGIIRWIGGEIARIDHEVGLEQESVLDVFVDREDLVWIASRGGGIHQLKSPHVLSYSVHDGLPNPVVQAALPRPGGEFIVGTAAGFCRMNTTGQVVGRYAYLGSVSHLHADNRNWLWVGGRDGLACFGETRHERLSIPEPLRELRNITTIAPGDDGDIMVCAHSGLWRIEGRAWSLSATQVESESGGARFNGLYQSPDGVAYLMTPAGLLRSAAGEPWASMPSSRAVLSMAAGPEGRMWLGTSQGLMTLEDGFYRDFYRRGAPHGPVVDMAVDHRGTLWMATAEGLRCYDGMRFAVFGEADGLPSGDVRCVCALSPGVLLAGTVEGLAVIESDRISPSSAPPRVVISDFKAGGEQYAITSAPLSVPHWQRNVSISYQGIGFRQEPKRLRYEWRLSGFAEEWSAPTPEPTRAFTNLSWGDYVFEVRAVNARGVRSDRVAAVSFEVGPPVWFNPWFAAGCAIVLAALLTGFVASQRKKRQLQRAAAAATVAKSEFLAKVSHEIRTPLTVILSCTEGLADPQDATARRPETIDALRRNSSHLLGLINDLLDLSKIEAGRLPVRLVPASVPEILAELDGIMRVNAESHGLDFRVLYETAVPEQIVTDAGRLRQALINLVGNAIKFTPEGQVLVRVRVEEGEGASRLIFDIEDTGVGVPPEKAKLIFEAFSQVESLTSRQFAGTGLGLAIAKSISERLYGEVSLRSELGRGSTFTLALDLSRAGIDTLGMEPTMVRPADLVGGRALMSVPPEPSGPVLSGRVLLAEDARDISEIMQLQLESAGASVRVVTNGPDAVRIASQGSFDVIIMDIHMPGMDGVSAIRELRARGVSTPIIVMSADSSEDSHRQCDIAGADGFVPKPYQKGRFLGEVGRHLDSTVPTESDPASLPLECQLELGSPRMVAVVKEFASSLGGRVHRMRAALERGDLETVAELAHQLKGAGGINGYMCVTEQARKLEDALDGMEAEAVRTRIDELDQLNTRILAGLGLATPGSTHDRGG
ncbi:MAG: response regulator [bacterium]|nr:response regulator [bacterium]